MMSINANLKVLGLQADASWDEVKSAFRHMARTYHPDVAGPEAARKFAEITEAYMTLKETISPSAVKTPSHAAAHRAQREEATVTDVEKRGSLFRAFWRKLLSLSFFRKKEHEETVDSAYEYDIPPARVRFIGGIISRAESDIHNLMSRRTEVRSRNKSEAILRRISSKHPGVTLLALKRISPKDAGDELLKSIADHFKSNMPTSEVLEALLGLFSLADSPTYLAKSLLHHAKEFVEADALAVIRWSRRHKLPREFYVPYLSHASDAVAAATLGAWPQSATIADIPETATLLKKEAETVLVPLLRMLKREKLPIWMASSVVKLSKEHKSAAVRVWASAIVREKNLG